MGTLRYPVVFQGLRGARPATQNRRNPYRVPTGLGAGTPPVRGIKAARPEGKLPFEFSKTSSEAEALRIAPRNSKINGEPEKSYLFPKVTLTLDPFPR